MKNRTSSRESVRKLGQPQQNRTYYEDLSRSMEGGRDQSMEWIIVKLHTKLKNLEGKHVEFVNYCADLLSENKRVLDEKILNLEESSAEISSYKLMQEVKFEREKVQKGLEYILTVQEEIDRGTVDSQDAKPSHDIFNALMEKITEAQNQVMVLCLRDAHNLNETDIKARILDIFKQLNEAVWNQIFKYKIKGDSRLQVRDWVRKIMQLEEDKKALLAQQKDYIDRYSSKIKEKQKNYEQEMSRLEAENHSLINSVGDLKEKLITINQQLKTQSQSIGVQKEMQKSIERRDAEPEKLALSQKVSVLGKKVATRRYQSTEHRQGSENGKQSPIPSVGSRYSTPILKDHSPMRAIRTAGVVSPLDRSLSPGARNNSTRELKLLKDQFVKLKNERDTLRVWKETVESEGPTYPFTVQRTISEFEAEKLNLQRRINLLQNKTKAFVRCVRVYISTCVRCQKALQLKDKDGIRLISKCEEERFKLELKLKDLTQGNNELDGLTAEPKPHSPTKRDLNLLQKENELLERENQRLEEMLQREREKTGTSTKSFDMYDLDYITDEKTDVDRLRRENEQLERENSSLENIIRKERERLDAMKKAFDTLEDDYNSISDTKGKLLGLQQDFEHLRKEKECLEDVLKIEKERFNTVNKALEAREKDILNGSELKNSIKILTVEKEYLNNQLKGLEEILKKEKERYEALQNTLKEREKDLTEMSDALADANTLIQENEHLEQVNIRLEGAIRKEQEKSEILNRSMNQHQMSASGHFKEVDSLTQENDLLINQNQLLTELLSKEKEVTENLKTAYSDSRKEAKELHELRSQLDSLKIDNHNLLNSLASERNRTDTLSGALENTEKEYAEVKSNLEQFNNLAIENSNYKQTVFSLNKTVQNLQQNVNSLTNSEREKAQELQELIGIKQKYQETVKTLNKKQNRLIELKEYKEKFEALSYVIPQKEDEIEILQDRLDNADGKINELYEAYKILEKTNKDVCKHRDELEETNRLLERNYKELMKYRDTILEEKKLLENEIMNIQQFIKGERNDKETLRKSLESNKLHTQTLDELNERVNILTYEKENISKELEKLKLSYQEEIRQKHEIEINAENIEKELVKLEFSYQEEIRQKHEIEKNAENIEKDFRQTQEENAEMKIRIQDYEKKEKELEDDIDRLKERCERYSDKDQTIRQLEEDLRGQEERNEDERSKRKEIQNKLREIEERESQAEIERESERIKLVNLLSKNEKNLKDIEITAKNEKQDLQAILTKATQDLNDLQAAKDAETNYFKSWAASEIDKTFLNLSSRFELINEDLNHKEESLRSIKKKAKEGLEATLKNLVEYNQIITEQVKERENLQFTISHYENTIKSQEGIINNLKHKFIGDQFSRSGLSIETDFETSCEEHSNIISELSYSLALKEKDYEELNNKYYDLNRENEELTKNKEELEEYYAMFPEKQAKLKHTEEMLEHQIKVYEQTLELKTEEINSLQMNNEHLARCANTMNQTINEQSDKITQLQEEFEHTIYEKSELILKLQEELQQSNNNLNQIALCYEDSKETNEQGTDPIEDDSIIQYQLQIQELQQNIERLDLDNQMLKTSKDTEIEDCMAILNSQKVKINELQSELSSLQEMLVNYQSAQREISRLQEENQSLLLSLHSLQKSSADQISSYESTITKHIDEVHVLKSELHQLEKSLGPHFKSDLYSSITTLVKRFPEPAVASLPPVYPPRYKRQETDSEIDIQIIRASAGHSEDESRSEASSSFVSPNLPTEIQALQEELIEQMKINRHHERQIKVLKLEIDNVKRRNHRQDMLDKSSEEGSLEGDHMKDIVVKLAKNMPIQNAEVEGCLKVLLSLIHLKPEESEDIERTRHIKPVKNKLMNIFRRNT